MTFTANGEPIHRIGYGAMILEGYYGKADASAAEVTLQHAIEHNI